MRRITGALFKKNLAVALLIVAFTFACPSAGFSQTEGYWRKPDNWEPYKDGPYFMRLQEILKTYRLSDSSIAYLHFAGIPPGIGDVELFRIALGQECSESTCYFVLFSSDLGDVPLITQCQFQRMGLAHLFNPDGSNFFGFEFSCQDMLLHVQVTKTQFWVSSVRRKP